MKKSTRERSFVLRVCSLFQSRVHTGTFIHRGYINDGSLDTKMKQMYPSLPYLDIQVIQGQRNLGVGYIFLLLHNLYLKKENKVLEEDAYNTKIISLKKVYLWAYFRPPSILSVSRQGRNGYTLLLGDIFINFFSSDVVFLKRFFLRHHPNLFKRFPLLIFFQFA